MQKKYQSISWMILGKALLINQGRFLPDLHISKEKKVQSAYHFHHMSTPLRQQLQALKCQVKQLPVLSVCLLSLLAARPCDNLEHQRSIEKSPYIQKNQVGIYPMTQQIHQESAGKAHLQNYEMTGAQEPLPQQKAGNSRALAMDILQFSENVSADCAGGISRTWC